MKRPSIAVLSVLILFCLASCNQDAIVDGGGTSPSVELKTSIEVPVPEFGIDMGDSSKGLIKMPIDYFHGDYDFACTVMTVLPTMTNLRSATISLDLNGRIKDGVSLYFHIYGFDLRLNAENSRFNDDGVYLQYDIMYDDSSVGFVDYYYNYKTRRFSYRQSVLCTLELPNEQTNNMILNLEYTDIEIKNPLSPEFEAGQLCENGYLDDNAVIDRFNLGDGLYDGLELVVYKPWFTRSFVTTKQVRDGIGDFITYSFIQPDTMISTLQAKGKKWKDIDYDGIETVMSKYVDKNGVEGTDFEYLIDTDEERKNADSKLVFEILPLMYENGKSIVARHVKDSGGYESYESFKDDSFKESLKSEFLKAFNVGEYCEGVRTNPIIYNSKNGKGTSSSEFCLIKDASTYKLSGFHEFYGECKEEDDKTMAFLIAKHLEACGITNASYISNFIKNYSENYPSPSYKRMDRVRADI